MCAWHDSHFQTIDWTWLVGAEFACMPTSKIWQHTVHNLIFVVVHKHQTRSHDFMNEWTRTKIKWQKSLQWNSFESENSFWMDSIPFHALNIFRRVSYGYNFQCVFTKRYCGLLNENWQWKENGILQWKFERVLLKARRIVSKMK